MSAPKPATALPWDTLYPATRFGLGATEREQNAAYAVHAANAYPKLVEALRLGRGAEDHLKRQALLRTLLRKLGEAE